MHAAAAYGIGIQQVMALLGLVVRRLAPGLDVVGRQVGVLVVDDDASSSCVKSARVYCFPCSMRTTVWPSRVSSRATEPPAVPEPTTTKSTGSVVANLRWVPWPA
jgi:hypothetical protein